MELEILKLSAFRLSNSKNPASSVKAVFTNDELEDFMSDKIMPSIVFPELSLMLPLIL